MVMERGNINLETTDGAIQEENSVRERVMKKRNADFSSSMLRRVAFMEQGRKQ
jgi:hypothetical protein